MIHDIASILAFRNDDDDKLFEEIPQDKFKVVPCSYGASCYRASCYRGTRCGTRCGFWHPEETSDDVERMLRNSVKCAMDMPKHELRKNNIITLRDAKRIIDAENKIKMNVVMVTDSEGWTTRKVIEAENRKGQVRKVPACPTPKVIKAENREVQVMKVPACPKSLAWVKPVAGDASSTSNAFLEKDIINNHENFEVVAKMIDGRIDIRRRLAGAKCEKEFLPLAALPESVKIDPKLILKLYKDDKEKSEKLAAQNAKLAAKDAKLAELAKQLAAYMAADKKYSAECMRMLRNAQGEVKWGDQLDSDSESEE